MGLEFPWMWQLVFRIACGNGQFSAYGSLGGLHSVLWGKSL